MMWTLSDPTDVIGTTVAETAMAGFPLTSLRIWHSTIQRSSVSRISAPHHQAHPGRRLPVAVGFDVPLDKGTFGLVAEAASETASSGELTYQDHGIQNRTVKSTAITSVTVSGNGQSTTGTATVNGSGFSASRCRCAITASRVTPTRFL